MQENIDQKTPNMETFHAVRTFISFYFTSNVLRQKENFFGQKTFTRFQNPFSLIRNTASLTRFNDFPQGFFWSLF